MKIPPAKRDSSLQRFLVISFCTRQHKCSFGSLTGEYPPATSTVTFIELNGKIIQENDMLGVILILYSRELLDAVIDPFDKVPDHLSYKHTTSDRSRYIE